MNSQKLASKKILKTKWGDIFDKYLAEGCDYAYAAYKADEWERSADKSPERSDRYGN